MNDDQRTSLELTEVQIDADRFMRGERLLYPDGVVARLVKQAYENAAKIADESTEFFDRCADLAKIPALKVRCTDRATVAYCIALDIRVLAASEGDIKETTS